MTGTGTSTNPYVISTWAELVYTASLQLVYIEITDGTVFDMNEIAPDGMGVLSIGCKQINANGAIIRNAFKKNNYAFNLSGAKTTINDLHILDAYFLKDSGTSATGFFTSPASSSYYANFNNCSISGKIENLTASSAYLFQGYANYINFNKSSFNIISNEAHVLSGYYSGTRLLELSNCNLKIKSNIQENAKLVNSLLTGELSGGLSVSSTSNSSVINANIASSISGGETGNHILVNSDNVASGITIPSGFDSVTTAQMIDASYLDSIGFPIGGV